MGTSCAGESTATVSSGSTTKKNQQNEVRAGAPTAATSAATSQKYMDPNNPKGFAVAPPPDAPDLTDKALKARRAAQALALLAGRGREQAFNFGGSGAGSFLGG